MPEHLGAHATSFLFDLDGLLRGTVATDGEGRELPLPEGLERALGLLREACAGGGRAYFLGNGGSAANASHLATDFWKLGGLEAWAFNDSSLLTCLGNDCGFQNVFAEPLKRFARPGDAVVAMSCSGRSPNILEGVRVARERGCRVLGLSGFDPDNDLRRQGEVNLYVPSHSYGQVEVAHLALVHSLLDAHVRSGGVSPG